MCLKARLKKDILWFVLIFVAFVVSTIYQDIYNYWYKSFDGLTCTNNIIPVTVWIVMATAFVVVYAVLGEQTESMGNEILLRYKNSNLKIMIVYELIEMVMLIPHCILLNYMVRDCEKVIKENVLCECIRFYIIIIFVTGFLYLCVMLTRNIIHTVLIHVLFIVYNMTIYVDNKAMMALKIYSSGQLSLIELRDKYVWFLIIGIGLHIVSYLLNKNYKSCN